jgi:hypothetical protein
MFVQTVDHTDGRASTTGELQFHEVLRDEKRIVQFLDSFEDED